MKRLVALFLVAACQRPEPKTPVPLDTASQFTADTTVSVFPMPEFETRPPQRGETDSAIVVNLVKRELGEDTVVYGPVRVRGDSASVVSWFSETSGWEWTLMRLRGSWWITGRHGPALGRRPK